MKNGQKEVYNSMTKDKKKSNPVSRLEFIKGAGLVVGGAAVGAALDKLLP